MSPNSTQETKSLCLYDNGCTINLSRRLNREKCSTWQLEDVINSYLQDDKEDEDEVQIGIRHDEHWLHCRTNVMPPQTILGIWEDYINDPETEHNVNPSTVLTIYETMENENTAISSSTNYSTPAKQPCSCVAPHSEWTRVERSAQDSLPPFQPNGDESSPIVIEWVDIRQWQRQQGEESVFLETPASVCHFLRSLLGSSHSSSPWVAQTSIGDEPHVVALVMNPNPPTTLTEFRVGNASPSFYLHSISQLYLPKDVVWIASLPPSASFSFGDLTEAALLLFRRIGPRYRLSIQHPLGEPENGTIVPAGCLWETYVEKKEEDDDNNEEEPVLQYRLLSPPYVSHKQDYPNLLEPLLTSENLQMIHNEAMSIPQWTAWPEKQHYSSPSEDGTASWTVFPLCHCFPANIVENRQWIQSTCAFVPETTALLKEHLGDTLRTALFSRLDPQTTLEPHTGWQDLANHVFRVHLPLVVPRGGLCGTWVDGCVETHEEGRIVCFDDAKVHRAFNYSSDERVVLILDLARPSHLPPGTATGGHTDELDKFIQQLT